VKYLLVLIVALSSFAQADNFYIDSLQNSYHFFNRSMNETHQGLGVSYSAGDNRFAVGNYTNSWTKNSYYLGWQKTIGKSIVGSHQATYGYSLTIADSYTQSKRSLGEYLLIPAVTASFESVETGLSFGLILAPTLIAFQPSLKF